MDSYEVGRFLVYNQKYCSSITVFPEKVIELKESGVDSKGYFGSFLIERIEIISIGTCRTCSIMNVLVKLYFIEQNILNFEFMVTGVAYVILNILISENRLVVTYL